MRQLAVRLVAAVVLSLSSVAAREAIADAPTPAASTDDIGARIVPTSRDNQLVGFKLFAIKEGSLLARMGAQAGDLVTHVAGTPATQAAQIVDAVLGGGAFTLTIERAGTVVTLPAP